MKKIMLVFGTRPEAIKMCPLVLELKKSRQFEVVVCVSGQHREMLKQVLDIFGVVPDYDLDIMKAGQDLFDITREVMMGMRDVLKTVQPDLVLVHGDTSTAYAAGLSAFYLQIPVGHVEAGLRTGNMASPFPEEFNRQGLGIIATYHFSPTEQARASLLAEGKNPDNIIVTGNTGIDALFTTVKKDFKHEILDWAGDSRLLVITAHRRENLGQPMHEMFRAIRRIMDEYPDVKAVYPIHMNPIVRQIAKEELSGCDGLRIIEPLTVDQFHNLLGASYLILTDSGGIQEEAPSLGKPVLVMRDTTERPEGIAAGTLKLTGTKEETIYNECKTLLTNPAAYAAMSEAKNPYGDGTASKQIRKWLEERL
ncbi:MAG: UDP-N-acetylglucosamine 2-epimerase (non-hydrolyzing) [Eubacteriales bacterium]